MITVLWIIAGLLALQMLPLILVLGAVAMIGIGVIWVLSLEGMLISILMFFVCAVVGAIVPEIFDSLFFKKRWKKIKRLFRNKS